MSKRALVRGIMVWGLGFQLAATASVGLGCPGDCNSDLSVSINELIVGVNMALGSAPVGQCSAFDFNGSGDISVDELVRAVSAALFDCPNALTVRGLCFEPGPSGLIPCVEGTAVNAARCDDRGACLSGDGSTPITFGTVGADGRFELRVDSGAVADAAVVFAAQVEPETPYRVIDFGLVGNAAAALLRLPRGRGQTVVDGIVIEPSTEAAVRLLDENGLENFSDEGATAVIEAVRTANADTNYAGLPADEAAALATDTALEDPAVQAVIEANLMTPTPTTGGSPVATPTPSATSVVVDTQTPTATGRPVATPTPTATGNGLATPTPTVTGATDGTATATANLTQTPTLTAPPLSTATPTATLSATDTPTPEPTVLTLYIGSAAGEPGSRVSIDVRMSTAGHSVAGTQNDIAFDPSAPIAVRDGRPDCVANPAIDKNATAFAFLPPGCSPGANCTGVRAVVLAFNNPGPIADGSVLYTCVVEIASDAEPSTLPLSCSNALSGSTPPASAIETACWDGQVTVGAPLAYGGNTAVSDRAGVGGTAGFGPCAGDCDGSGAVTFNELLISENIALGSGGIVNCPAVDTSGDGRVDIVELLVAVENANNGCPA